MRELKVYGGMMHGRGVQVRTIVAAKSWAEASRLTGESLHHMRGYWSITGNPTECAVAMAKPGTVFQASDRWAQNFVAVESPVIGGSK